MVQTKRKTVWNFVVGALLLISAVTAILVNAPSISLMENKFLYGTLSCFGVMGLILVIPSWKDLGYHRYKPWFYEEFRDVVRNFVVGALLLISAVITILVNAPSISLMEHKLLYGTLFHFSVMGLIQVIPAWKALSYRLWFRREFKGAIHVRARTRNL